MNWQELTRIDKNWQELTRIDKNWQILTKINKNWRETRSRTELIFSLVSLNFAIVPLNFGFISFGETRIVEEYWKMLLSEFANF